MKIRVCDICRKEKDVYFKCKIKEHTMHIEGGLVFDDPMWFKAEVCEDCLKKIMDEVSE